MSAEHRIPHNYSEEYRAARAEVNRPTLETIKPIIYPSGTLESWAAFNESLRTFPEKRSLIPWKSDDPEQIRIEAMERGILIDKFPDILKDVAKRKWNPRYTPDFFEENPHLLQRYVTVFDRPQFQTRFEFPWTTDGAFVIGSNEQTTRETIYSSLVQDDPRLFTSQDFEGAGQLKIGIIGMGVGASVADALIEFGVRHIDAIDGGNVILHDFARFPNAGLPRIGKNHAELWAQRAYEMYPFGDFNYYKQFIGDGSNGTIDRRDFIRGHDIIVEVVDNPLEKLLDREEAAEQCVPVYMTTDVLMGSIMTRQLGIKGVSVFSGWNDNDRERMRSGEKMDFVEKSKMAQKIVGSRADYWVEGALKGRSNWSQNGAQTAASKVAMAYTLRRIVRGLPIPDEKEFAIIENY